jgi:hypothetical protein
MEKKVLLFFFLRGRKDFICREFICREEKRETAYWRMQGDPETSDPQKFLFYRSLFKKRSNLNLIKPLEQITLLIYRQYLDQKSVLNDTMGRPSADFYRTSNLVSSTKKKNKDGRKKSIYKKRHEGYIDDYV